MAFNMSESIKTLACEAKCLRDSISAIWIKSW